MLEFIVLGNIPGTQFNITYSWALAFMAVFLIVLEVRYHKQYALKVAEATAAATSRTQTTTSPRKAKAKTVKPKSPQHSTAKRRRNPSRDKNSVRA